MENDCIEPNVVPVKYSQVLAKIEKYKELEKEIFDLWANRQMKKGISGMTIVHVYHDWVRNQLHLLVPENELEELLNKY